MRGGCGFLVFIMIDKKELIEVVKQELQGSDLFLVQVNVSADNVIEVLLDSMSDVSIDDCVRVNNAVLAAFDRDKEDYELTVGSYGISSPLLVHEQYLKSIGNEVEVLTRDGRKLKGTLTQAQENDFTITIPTKVKEEGKKRPQLVDVPTTLLYTDIKYTKNIIKF